MAIVIRIDLDMSIGKMIAQACHAAVEANNKIKRCNYKIWKKWKNDGAKKVALKCESLEELEKIEEQAKKQNISFIRIVDAGYTELLPGTITCLSVGPHLSDIVDKITGNLNLI
jgi:PTH2 family peptidyl-tRNA hydrolase